MIEYVVLTGELKDGMIGCSAFGRHFFARPIFGTAFQSVPSAMWLEKYKKHFFGLVTYENRKNESEHDRPLFLGVVPVQREEYKTPGLEDIHNINTSKYRVQINDAEEYLTIERFDGVSYNIKKDNVYINSRKINLGKENADYKAVLGDIAADIVDTFVTIMKTGKVNTGIGPQPFMPPTQLKLAELKNRISTMLSKVVKLD